MKISILVTDSPKLAQAGILGRLFGVKVPATLLLQIWQPSNSAALCFTVEDPTQPGKGLKLAGGVIEIEE